MSVFRLVLHSIRDDGLIFKKINKIFSDLFGKNERKREKTRDLTRLLVAKFHKSKKVSKKVLTSLVAYGIITKLELA